MPAGGRAVDRRRVRHPTVLRSRDGADALYERIDARVDAMVAAGRPSEVQAADAAGASRTATRGAGFGELLAGDIDGMKARTRRYAKRQVTWMRKLGGV